MSASSSVRANVADAEVSFSREKDVYDLVVPSGRREDGDERFDGCRDEIGLLGQLAPCRLDGRLPRDVEEACGDLPVAVADRVAVLLDQQDALLVVDRDDGGRSGVVDVLPHDLAVAVADGVAAHVPHAARVDEFARGDVGLERLVAEARGLRHARPRP